MITVCSDIVRLLVVGNYSYGYLEAEGKKEHTYRKECMSQIKDICRILHTLVIRPGLISILNTCSDH
jgi:hypothetical protein